MRRPYLDVAKDYLENYHPNARCALVAGSMLRGEETTTSDIDLVVMYDQNYQTPHRDSVMFQDWMIEVFSHNPQSQDYFINEDIQSGCAITLDMIIHGYVIGHDHDFAETRKAKAKTLFANGPASLSKDEIIKRRYFITDQLDDVIGAKNNAERQGSLTELYKRLGDFHLRANKRWSGHGKWMLRALKRDNKDFAENYAACFDKAFKGDINDLVKLTDEILQPFGGQNRVWKSPAPEAWKNIPIE